MKPLPILALLLAHAVPLAAQGPAPERGPVRPDTMRGARASSGRTRTPPPLAGRPAATPPAASTAAPTSPPAATRAPASSPAPAPSPYRPPALLGSAVEAKIPRGREMEGCTIRDITRLGRNPTPAELRCRYGARGPGRFGLLSYLDVPVYQPRTPLPGTHVVGVPGMPHPAPGETFEQWEWRVLRTTYGPAVRTVRYERELLDPVFESRLREFERRLRARGVRASRRETWRSPERQAWVFQSGRSRPGPIATSTLTSWHNRVDRLGRPAARAADYAVAGGDLRTFHAVAAELGIEGYGADSNDPGHVYLPDTDAATGMEVAVLRLLPRVPHVTLETGRPYDEAPIPGMPNHWRELTALFLARWDPWARADITLPTLALGAIRLPPAPPPPPPPPPAPARRGRRGG